MYPAGRIIPAGYADLKVSAILVPGGDLLDGIRQEIVGGVYDGIVLLLSIVPHRNIALESLDGLLFHFHHAVFIVGDDILLEFQRAEGNG